MIEILSRRRFLMGALALSGGALLAACGGDDDDDDSAASTPDTTEEEATSESTEASESTDVEKTEEPAATTEEPDAMETETEEVEEATETASSGEDGQTVASQLDLEGIQKGGHVSFGLNGDVAHFFPIAVTDGNSGSVTGLIFEGLVTIDPDTLQPAPLLASKWDVSDDYLTYTFTIKDGVKWHDGETLTAEDVKFSFDAAANPDTGSTSSSTLQNRIASVEATDEQTIVITLTAVNAPFLVADAGVTIMPKHILGDMAPEDMKTSDFAENPVGTGPFKFKERAVGQYVQLDAHPEYHRGAPALDSVIIKVGRDNTAVYQQLKTGEIDALAITPAFYADAVQQDNLRIVLIEGFGYQFIGFNLDETKGSPHLQDVRVRQALCYAMNRQGIVDKVENGLSEVAIGTYPSVSWAYQPDQIELKYEYDPEKAAALLDEAGWVPGDDGIRMKDGERLAFVISSLAGSKRFEGFTTVMQDNWKEIGVELEVQIEEFQAFISRVTSTFEFQIFILGTGDDADPDQSAMWATDSYPSGLNLVKYSNPKVDELLQAGIETLDVDERTDIYVEMQNLVLADMPAFITTFSTTAHGINNRLKNFIPSAIDERAYSHAHLWYVTDGA